MQELMNATRVVGLRQLRRLKRAQTLTWPNMINGFVLTRVMQTLLNVGFFDELTREGRVDPGPFAARNNFDDSILRSLCDALYASHILEKEGNAYRLTSQGQLLIDVGRGWFTGMYGYEPVYHDLEKLLRKEREYGVNVARLTDAVAEGSGQIEGIYTAPHFVAQDRTGKRHAEKSWGEGAKLGHAGALDHLVAYVREHLGGDRLVGVGHRVVHGGPRFDRRPSCYGRCRRARRSRRAAFPPWRTSFCCASRARGQPKIAR
jgi:hypothetical protein